MIVPLHYTNNFVPDDLLFFCVKYYFTRLPTINHNHIFCDYYKLTCKYST